jgi:hypothetical protein
MARALAEISDVLKLVPRSENEAVIHCESQPCTASEAGSEPSPQSEPQNTAE